MKYSELAAIYSRLSGTSKRLEKTDITAEAIKKASSDELEKVVLLLQGRVFPNYDESNLGIASRLIIKAISRTTGISSDKVEKEWKKLGDLGSVAEEFTKKKEQSTLFSSALSVKKVFDNIKKLPSAEGKGAVDNKIKLISELLSSAKPAEAKYIVRTVLEDLRIGVGEGSIRDAIVWAFFGKKLGLKYDKKENDISLSKEEREEYNKIVNIVQEAYDVLNDFSEVARLAKKGIKELEKVKLEAGKPIKVMLFQKAEDIDSAFERVGKPCAFEYKYDGFRIQCHCNKEVKLFTRRLDNVTKQFPDVAKIMENNVKAKSFILDAEIIGIDPKTKKWLPFQHVSQRIKRKYDIDRMTKDIPVIVNVFDIMELDGKSMLKIPFKERRDKLKKIVKEADEKLYLAEQIVTDKVEKANNFYQEALQKGNEGIMAKNLDSPYKPGSRVGYGVKIKPTMENLDLVITGAEWGTGKRANVLSSFSISCRDDSGNFLEIGKVGTGIKEKEELGVSFIQLTKLIKPLIVSESGRSVKVQPSVVVEIGYEEIQKSPTYSSGFALRFPRLINIRNDRSADEISDLNLVEDLYYDQRGR